MKGVVLSVKQMRLLLKMQTESNKRFDPTRNYAPFHQSRSLLAGQSRRWAAYQNGFLMAAGVSGHDAPRGQ
jgi:hypothetical protein